jgi:hypothetical protein
VNQGFCLNTESTSFKAVVRSFVGESGEGTNRAGGKRQQSFHFLTKKSGFKSMERGFLNVF